MELNACRYQFMSLDALESTIKRFPVVLQPTGILEWHGKQNAVGLDALVSQYICEKVIERLGDGVLMPTNWIGTYGYVHYPGTVCYDEETTYNVFLNMYREFIKLGFKLIMIISGHGGGWQVKAMNRAKDACLNGLTPETRKSIELMGLVYPGFTPGISIGHASWTETSMLWHIGNEYGVPLVDINKSNKGKEKIPKYTLPYQSNVPIEGDEEPDYWEWKEDLKDPETCSPERGKWLLDQFITGIINEIEVYREELGF